jgi:hypothetical protein
MRFDDLRRNRTRMQLAVEISGWGLGKNVLGVDIHAKGTQ